MHGFLQLFDLISYNQAVFIHNKTKVISADFLDFDFDFDDIIIMFVNISVLVTF